jgi:hypothetical protein
MSFQPIPCAHCGTNFMRRSIDPEAPRLCNNCDLKVARAKPKGDLKMENVKILIDCTRKVQIEVEEYCVNMGMSISDYFVSLHDAFQASYDDPVYKIPVEKQPEKDLSPIEDDSKKPKAKKK